MAMYIPFRIFKVVNGLPLMRITVVQWIQLHFVGWIIVRSILWPIFAIAMLQIGIINKAVPEKPKIE